MCLESVAILVLGQGDLRPHVYAIYGGIASKSKLSMFFVLQGVYYQNYQHFLKKY